MKRGNTKGQYLWDRKSDSINRNISDTGFGTRHFFCLSVFGAPLMFPSVFYQKARVGFGTLIFVSGHGVLLLLGRCSYLGSCVSVCVGVTLAEHSCGLFMVGGNTGHTAQGPMSYGHSRPERFEFSKIVLPVLKKSRLGRWGCMIFL